MSLDYIEDFTNIGHPLFYPGEAVVGWATCVVLRSTANGSALAEQTVSRLLAEAEPKRPRCSAPDPDGVAASQATTIIVPGLLSSQGRMSIRDGQLPE